MRSKFAVLVFVLLVISHIQTLGQNFYLKNNDRVLFFGDSITEHSFYTNYVETYIVTRFLNLNISFINSGWSGDRVYGGGGGTTDERLKRDVFPHKPTVMTIMFGMNDGCYVEFNVDCYNGFTKGYEYLLSSLKKDLPNLRLTLLQPSPFDDWTESNSWRLAPPIKGGYNNILLRYSQFVADLAKKNSLTKADMNTPLIELIKFLQKTDPEFAKKIIPDRIHPSSIGGLVMAANLLDSWKAPIKNSRVLIDVSSKKQPISETSQINNFRADETISWIQLDDSLPFPFDISDENLSYIIFATTVSKIIDNQVLSIVGLNAGNYLLKIDGESIGTFSSENLMKGVSLGLLKTPMMKQAFEVHQLTEQRNRVHFIRWREFQIPFEKENNVGMNKVLKDLDDLEIELIRKQRLTAQPKPHHFEVIPVK